MKLLGHICTIFLITNAVAVILATILPGPQQGPQGVSSVWGEQVAANKRGDGPERQTTSAGRLVNSGSRENIESVD